jgi:hypothetical protein
VWCGPLHIHASAAADFVSPPSALNTPIRFPAYYNFFFKRQPVNLIVEPEVEAKIRTVFQETLFGPEAIDYDADFAPDVPPEQRPDLLKELRYFRKFGDQFLEIDMLLRFTHFDAKGPSSVSQWGVKGGRGKRRVKRLT